MNVGRPLAPVLLSLLLAACGTTPDTPDASDTTPDAAGGGDAGGFDAGGTPDASDGPDAGGADAGDEPDAGSLADAGDEPDAGEEPVDAGPPRCTTGACYGMIASCGVQYFDEPTNGVDPGTACTGEIPENGKDIAYAERYCVPVCEATDTAGFLDCMATRVNRCLNGESGSLGNVAQECRNLFPAPAKDDTCVNACNVTRLSCDRACATNNSNQWLACMDCQLDCGIARANCRAACPAP